MSPVTSKVVTVVDGMVDLSELDVAPGDFYLSELQEDGSIVMTPVDILTEGDMPNDDEILGYVVRKA